MIGHFIKALGQLSDPRTRRVLWKSVAASAALFGLAIVVAWYSLQGVAVFDVALLDEFIAVLGVLAVFLVAILLFPGAVSVVTGLFLEEVAAACEARHYPNLPPPRRQSLGETVIVAARFAIVTIALNLLCAPVYLLLLLVPPLNLFVFYGVNGYVLGREYFELVALRRLEPERAEALRRAYRVRLWLSGAGIAFLLTLPVINLVAPVLATAFMVHVVEAIRRSTDRNGTTGAATTAR
jgi:uncharacterized protein involved in cysteine biosynthesis